MRTFVLGLLLALVLGLLSEAVQRLLGDWLRRDSRRVFAGPLLLSAVFCAAAYASDTFSLPLAALIFLYTVVPTAVAFLQNVAPPSWADGAVILMLWLPLELAMGEQFVPKPAQGFLHSVAYGVAISLALWLFLLFRRLEGMKYQPPRRTGDLANPLLGFVAVAPFLIGLGLWLGFLTPFHVRENFSPAWTAKTFVVIFVATALPEEILFRALIQNAMMRVWGESNRTLLAAAVIFGFAHLNNAPAPNWRYVILASIAGYAYGKVFQKSSSVLSAAFLHALVNTVRHGFF